MSDFDVVYRGATLTVSGCVEKPDGEPPYFVLEEIRCGDQDISDIVEVGSDHWVEIEARCNQRTEREIKEPFQSDVTHRGERAFFEHARGATPVR